MKVNCKNCQVITKIPNYESNLPVSKTTQVLNFETNLNQRQEMILSFKHSRFFSLKATACQEFPEKTSKVIISLLNIFPGSTNQKKIAKAEIRLANEVDFSSIEIFSQEEESFNAVQIIFDPNHRSCNYEINIFERLSYGHEKTTTGSETKD